MKIGIIAAGALASLAIMIGGTAPAQGGAAIDPADFRTAIDNPYFPLSAFQTLSYEGEEQDPDTGETIDTRGEWTILPETKTVAGITVLVLRDQAYADGELVESTLDYFAQHRDGTVYYFGEDVDNYEDGVLVDHEGSWLAGEGQNEPGIFMPASPVVGVKFDQERAPGIAEDHSTVLETALTVTVPAGTFSDCIKTEDVDPIGGATENKWYCRGVGFVKEQAEDEALELVRSATAQAPAAGATPSAGTAAETTAPVGTDGPASAPATGSDDDGGTAWLWVGIAAAVAAVGLGAGGVIMWRRRARDRT